MDGNGQIQEAVDQIVALVTAYGLDVIGAVVILIVGWVAAGWMGGLVRKGLGKVKSFDDTLREFFGSLVKYGILAVTVIAVLDRFGVETTSFVAVLGAAGLAIGLALQGTLSNVAAGVMLLIFRPFRSGDYIDAGSVAGTVKYTSLFVTELATPDNVKIVAPNSQLWGTAIRNYSANPTRRVDIGVGIGYGDEIDKAQSVAMATVASDARVHKDPEPIVVVGGLGESSVDLIVRFWCDAGDYWGLKFDLTKGLKQAFDREGICIPFPQRDIHIQDWTERASSGKDTAK